VVLSKYARVTVGAPNLAPRFINLISGSLVGGSAPRAMPAEGRAEWFGQAERAQQAVRTCRQAAGGIGPRAGRAVRGLAVLFPGFSTIVLGASMECGELCTVAFLARHRCELPRLARFVLGALILIIACINGTGVFSQLIAQHALTQHDGRHSRPPLSCEVEGQQDQWPRHD
jgi:hypothetical protein